MSNSHTIYFCPLCEVNPDTGEHEFGCPCRNRLYQEVITVGSIDAGDIDISQKKKPHVCPVCDGKGFVPSGFYEPVEMWASSSASNQQCRTCNGTGLVWG